MRACLIAGVIGAKSGKVKPRVLVRSPNVKLTINRNDAHCRASQQLAGNGLAENAILIVGGGIGGLSLAIGLVRAGLASKVLEKSSKFGEIGAGIQLGPNAFHCFDRLGIGDKARQMAVYIDGLRLMDAINGERICHIDLGDNFRQRYGNPYAVVHRGDLHNVLQDACEASDLIELHTSSEVVDYRQDGSRVEAILAGGEIVAGVALVGADGLWSKIREKLVNDGPPRVSGHTTYRSVVPFAQMPEELRWNAATLWAGPRCHIVHYPLSDWKLFNLVVTYHNDAPEPVAGLAVAKEEVLKGFQHIHPLPRSIIEARDDWRMWVLCDREPVENWSQGRVTLLGDAAHPTLQYLAQGACMAMEDAVVLSDTIGNCDGDFAAAFMDYQTRRITRTARVTLASRAMGEHIYHPAGAHAKVRDELLKNWSQEEYYHRLDWLYGGIGEVEN